ncbi:MAG: ferrochelatase, partial [Candidatus Binatia bacterium]
MAAPFDAVLLIAFGGPNTMDEVRPFLANVLRGRPAPPERVEAVVHHYELMGGRSPLTELTLRQAAALRPALADAGLPLPVFVGMRNWHPYLAETLAEMQRAGVRRAVGFILAAQQNEAGWDRYQRDVADARAALGEAAPAVDFTPGWHAHPLFIEAVAARAATALATLPAARRAAARLIFSA